MRVCVCSRVDGAYIRIEIYRVVPMTTAVRIIDEYVRSLPGPRTRGEKTYYRRRVYARVYCVWRALCRGHPKSAYKPYILYLKVPAGYG